MSEEPDASAMPPGGRPIVRPVRFAAPHRALPVSRPRKPESLRGLRIAVLVVFGALTLLGLLAALASYGQASFLTAVAAGAAFDEEEAARVDARREFYNLPEVAGIVCGAAVFLPWFFRAHRNLRRARVGGLHYGSGWTIGGFFVPILNIVRPFQVMQETWSGSARMGGVDGQSLMIARSTGLVALWWCPYVASGLLDFASARVLLNPSDLPDVRLGIRLQLFGDLAHVAAAAACAVLILRITAMQENAERVDDVEETFG